MSYCRYCGVEITYKRSKNDKWIPCDFITGEPHFCRENKTPKETGIIPCKICGKPTFIKKQGKKTFYIDYSTLAIHQCKKADVTRFIKYQQKQLKLEMEKRAKRFARKRKIKNDERF